MKKQLNEEFRRMQKLAGIINENEEKINESPSEKEILDDILGSLEEGMFSNVLDKVKKYAKRGLITISILAALLGSTQLTTSQKDEVKDVVKTEMSTTAEDMTVGFQLLSFYKVHQNDKSMSSWSKQNPSSSLISDIKNIIDNKLEKNKDVIEMLGQMHGDEAQTFLDSYNTFYINEELRRMQKLAGIINENEEKITLADILTEKGKLDQLKGTYLKIIEGPFTDKPENEKYLNKGCKFLFYDVRTGLVGVELEDKKSVNLYPKELIIDTERANAY